MNILIPIWSMVHKQMEYGLVWITNLHRSDYLKTWSSKPWKDKDQKFEDRRLDQWISQSNSNTAALQSVCTIKHKHEILKFFVNWIIIFIIDYFMEFSLFWCILQQKFYNSWYFYEYLVVKILQLLGFLQISCYLETLLKECEISGDLKKILETWQHCSLEKWQRRGGRENRNGNKKNEYTRNGSQIPGNVSKSETKYVFGNGNKMIRQYSFD